MHRVKQLFGGSLTLRDYDGRNLFSGLRIFFDPGESVTGWWRAPDRYRYDSGHRESLATDSLANRDRISESVSSANVDCQKRYDNPLNLFVFIVFNGLFHAGNR